MAVTNRSLRLMAEWIATQTAEGYSFSSSRDHPWPAGGTVHEVLEEARLSPEWIVRGISRFVGDRLRR